VDPRHAVTMARHILMLPPIRSCPFGGFMYAHARAHSHPHPYPHRATPPQFRRIVSASRPVKIAIKIEIGNKISGGRSPKDTLAKK